MAQPTLRTLVETEEYLDQLEKLGNAADLDEALRGVLWSLAVNPHVWPVIPGFKRLRLAWTDPAGGPTRKQRSLQVWFEIRDPNYVDLFFVDYVDEDS